MDRLAEDAHAAGQQADHQLGDQQQGAHRNRGQRNQSHINDAVNLLSAAAALTGREVALVVSAHLQRQAGNVITPAPQNLAYDRINTLLTHGYTTVTTPEIPYSRIGSKASDCAASNTRL